MIEPELPKKPNLNKLGLRKNFLWTVSGTIISAGMQMLIMVLVQKMLGTEALGDYTFALSISLPVFLFTGLSLNMRMVIDVEDSHHFNEYFGVRIFLNFISVLTVIAIVVLGKYSLQLIIISSLVAVYHSMFMLSTLAQGVFQKHEYMNYLGISRIVQSIMSISSFAAGIHITKSMIGGLFILCIFSLLKFVFYDLHYVRRFDRILPDFNFTLLKSIFLKCWVISISAGMVSFTGNLPRYLVKSYLGTESLGFFTGVSATTMGMSLVIVALSAVALRRLAVYYNENITGFITLLLKLFSIAICFGLMNLLFVFAAGNYFLKIFFDETYVTYLNVMYVYAGAGIFLALISIVGDTVLSTGRYWWRIFASIGAVAAMSIAGYVMLPQYGLLGVAWICVIGFGAELLICSLGLLVLTKKQRTKSLYTIQNVLENEIPIGIIEKW